MLQEMYFRSVQQRAELQRRTEDAAKQLEQTRLHSTHVEEFAVREDLMGLAIGAHGQNIQVTGLHRGSPTRNVCSL